MRLHIVAVSYSCQLHAVDLQAQALQSMLSPVFGFEHGGPRDSLPLASHVLPVLSVVCTTKNQKKYWLQLRRLAPATFAPERFEPADPGEHF